MKKIFTMKRFVTMGLVMITICLLGLNDPYLINAADTYYTYEESYQDPNPKVSWSYEHTNAGSLADSLTRTLTRDVFFSGTISGETQLNLFTQKVKAKAEVSLGTTRTTSTSITYSFAPYTITTVEYGSKKIYSEGAIVKWIGGDYRYGTPVYGEFTYGEYSVKKEKAL